MIKKIIINKFIKKWQNYLSLQDFKIYIIKENQKNLNESWKKDKRAKQYKNYLVKADVHCDPKIKNIFIRLSKDLTKDEIEENIIHELLHVKVKVDEEWAVLKLTNYLLKDRRV